MRPELRRIGRKLLPPVLVVGLGLVLVFTFGKKQDTAANACPRATLVIDPGHGGIDSGAVGADGTRESDINLAIATRKALKLFLEYLIDHDLTEIEVEK